MSADFSQQKTRYIADSVSAMSGLVAAIQAARNLRTKYDARGYAGGLADADLAGAGYPHLTAADYHDALAKVEAAWATADMQAAMVALLQLVP